VYWPISDALIIGFFLSGVFLVIAKRRNTVYIYSLTKIAESKTNTFPSQFSKGDDHMEHNLRELLRDLSDIYDNKSKNMYVTVYLNSKEGNKFIQRREDACASLLKVEEKKNFLNTITRIKEYLKNKQKGNFVIFASDKYHFFKPVSLPMQIQSMLVVDSSPYIRPLARIQDEWESFTLVLLNSNYAQIYSLSLGIIQNQKKLSKDIINRHKKGGQSQARFQRIRKGAIHKFFMEVAEALSTLADDTIVLAGPGTAKLQFKEILTKHLQEKIIDIVDISINDEQSLISESIRLIAEYEQKKSKKAIQQLKQEILKDGLAVYGLNETLKAAQNGQIELLIIEKDYKVKGCLCEHCQILNTGPIKDCPVCGEPTTEADVIEEIIEFAERTDASIEFSDDEELSNLGHIGALLRFK
jgi:peptide chain release factor subunit 1